MNSLLFKDRDADFWKLHDRKRQLKHAFTVVYLLLFVWFPGKHFKDSAIVKMADVCSKMVDGWVNFPVPVLDHSLLSEPDSRPAEAGALCSFPQRFSALINCSPQSKRLKSQYKACKNVSKHTNV